MTAHPHPENLESTELALNGKHLALGADGTLPAQLLRNGGVLHNGYDYLGASAADDENRAHRPGEGTAADASSGAETERQLPPELPGVRGERAVEEQHRNSRRRAAP